MSKSVGRTTLETFLSKTEFEVNKTTIFPMELKDNIDAIF
jgi:hypothetical protein